LHDDGVIRLVSEPDDGWSDALNKGFRLAQGELVTSLNADDYYLPGALERVSSTYQADPRVPWITGRCIIVDAHDREIQRPVTAYKDLLLRHYSYWLLLTQCFVSSPSTFFARRALESVGFFDARLLYAADYDLFLRVGRLGPPAIIPDDPLAAFRLAGDTLSLLRFEERGVEGRAVARHHGAGRPLVIAAHLVMSVVIMLAYRAMLSLRRARGRN
jgi:glycosyltransferase involved in cell wall biosynthesis